jgi:hypothetical protein
MRLLAIVLVTLWIGCAADEPTDSVTSDELHADHRNPNPVLFAKDARPFGRSMERWAELAWKWILAQPADHNPLLDNTGVDCAVGQEGPVWFIPSVVPNGRPVFFTRTCTIPRHRALLVQMNSIFNDFPCPDPSFHPAPGQTLYDFLADGAAAFIDTTNLIEVSLDGVALEDMLGYRFTSDDLFHIKGDLSLQSTLDGCITGEPQPAVADGFFIMFKPLRPGAHTIVVHTTDTFGMTGDTTVTYNLTIQ